MDQRATPKIRPPRYASRRLRDSERAPGSERLTYRRSAGDHYVCSVTRRRPATQPRQRLSRAAEDRQARDSGLRLSKLNLFVTISAVLVTAIGIFVAVVLARPSAKPEPGVLVVVSTTVDIGGAPVVAAPVDPPTAVDWLRGGAQLRVDCFVEVSGKYGFAHIIGSFEANRWIDLTKLVLPNGRSAGHEVAKLGICKS